MRKRHALLVLSGLLLAPRPLAPDTAFCYNAQWQCARLRWCTLSVEKD
jgi:hypothetical protein